MSSNFANPELAARLRKEAHDAGFAHRVVLVEKRSNVCSRCEDSILTIADRGSVCRQCVLAARLA